MEHINRFSYIHHDRPALLGKVRGGIGAENAEGTISVFPLENAMYFTASFTGLPPSEIFGFHIHEGIVCGEVRDGENFPDAGAHYSNCADGSWCDRHPYHAGDLPPIFSDTDGNAVMEVYLDRAIVEEISGRVIILHSNKDDFKSQPSGNSGVKIACGVLAEYL